MIFAKALRLAAEVRRLRRANAELLDALRAANVTTARWRSRAELLYVLAPQPIADQMLRDQGRIEDLSEVTS